MRIQSGIGIRTDAGEYADHIGDIQNVEQPAAAVPVSGATLSPVEASHSLRQEECAGRNSIQALTNFLGPALTSGNPVWTGDPVPKMRSLQKVLLEYGLSLPESERGAALQAISVVEQNIRLRLRLQQLRMFDYGTVKAPEKDVQS